MKKILVTGGSGLLGSRIVGLAKADHQIIPTHFRDSLFPNSMKLDITKKRSVFQIVQRIHPDIIIHTAAETNVDKCENNRVWAWKTNAESTGNLAEASEKTNAKMVYISTDYVFDGEKGMYTEEDKPNPVDYYGLTKLKGEEFLTQHSKDYVIARPSVVYGWNRRKLNFVTWIIESLRQGKNVQVVDDHFNSPTLADNLAEALFEVIESDLSGIYHIAGSERISRYEFSRKVAKAFDLDSGLIKPVRMKELKAWTAKRPRDSSLSIEKAQNKLKTRLLSVQESLNIMKKTEEDSDASLVSN